MTLVRRIVVVAVVVRMVVASVHSFNLGQLACSPNICAVVSCLRPDCSPPSVLRSGGFCGCCPVCVTEVEAGESCDGQILTQNRVCKRGYVCDDATATCRAVNH